MASAEIQSTDWKEGVPSDTKVLVRKGYIALLLTIGVFFLWASAAPLSGAVVSTGKIFSELNNSPVQHPFGGVVKELLVEEGELVKKGQLIAVIEPENAEAELANMRAQRNVLLASKKRLEGLEGINDQFNLGALRGADIEPSSVGFDDLSIAAQQDILGTAVKVRQVSNLTAFEKQLNALNAELAGVKAQIKKRKQLKQLLDKQFNRLSNLANNGHVAKSQVWDLEAQILTISSELSSLEASRVSLDERIAETRENSNMQAATFQQENSLELSNVLVELASIEERLSAAENTLSYSQVTAPADGVLTNMSAKTVGGVIPAREPVAEIVPHGGPYYVKVQILPSDINSIHLDASAEVVVTAFNARLTDPFEGIVEYISADSQIDEMTGQPFFTAHIKLQPSENLSEIKTGMYAQTYIKTESRTFVGYLFKPLADSFRKAFNET